MKVISRFFMSLFFVFYMGLVAIISGGCETKNKLLEPTQVKPVVATSDNPSGKTSLNTIITGTILHYTPVPASRMYVLYTTDDHKVHSCWIALDQFEKLTITQYHVFVGTERAVTNKGQIVIERNPATLQEEIKQIVLYL